MTYYVCYGLSTQVYRIVQVHRRQGKAQPSTEYYKQPIFIDSLQSDIFLYTLQYTDIFL